MKKQLLAAALAVAGVAAFATSPGATGPNSAELVQFFPICGTPRAEGLFCVEPYNLDELRPPWMPLELWRQIISR